MKTNLDIIKELYQLFATKNTEAIRQLFADNISWKQMEGFPNGGHYIGADDIFTNVFDSFGKHWTGWKAEVSDFKATDDSVFVIGNYSGTYNLTNKFMQAAFIHHYILADGKVAEFTQYTDTKLIADAMS